MKKGMVAFLVVAGGIIFLVIKGNDITTQRDTTINTSTDPLTVVTAIIDNSEAKTAVTTDNQTMRITIDDISALAANNKDRLWSFDYDTTKMVPVLFSKFSDINRVEVIALGNLVDIRGHETKEPVATIAFTRANSAQIQWDHIKVDNIDLLADDHSIHPAMLKE
jgi:hypothetical protein